jgi:hypothetical protein
MAVIEVPIESLPQLVSEVLAKANENPPVTFYWFRGANCSEYDLLPSLMRDGKSGEEVFEREARLITRFRQRSIAYWPAGYPQTDWEHLFAMQHHGMPTRLLDWSENLMIAAYFALNSAPRHDPGLHAGPCRPCIWCVDPTTWNRQMPSLSEYGDSIRVLTTADDHLEAYRPLTIKRRLRSPVAIYGTHNSQRIVAQRGTFFVWGSETQSMQSTATAVNSTRLLKFVFTTERANLYRDIQSLGVTETTVFPELAALATELARLEDWS